jgi:hypothetical protein
VRVRITVRGTDIELRGYLDDDNTDYRLVRFSKAMEPFGVVVASPAADDYDPFFIQGIPTEDVWQMQATVIQGERALREGAEAELRDRELHHFEVEQENARLMATNTELAQLLAATEGRADEYTRMMVGRVNEAEGVVDQIKAIRSNFPEKCDVHDDDDITCGWKHMIAGIDEVLK